LRLWPKKAKRRVSSSPALRSRARGKTEEKRRRGYTVRGRRTTERSGGGDLRVLCGAKSRKRAVALTPLPRSRRARGTLPLPRWSGLATPWLSSPRPGSLRRFTHGDLTVGPGTARCSLRCSRRRQRAPFCVNGHASRAHLAFRRPRWPRLPSAQQKRHAVAVNYRHGTKRQDFAALTVRPYSRLSRLDQKRPGNHQSE
jgi:hypothetical protein